MRSSGRNTSPSGDTTGRRLLLQGALGAVAVPLAGAAGRPATVAAQPNQMRLGLVLSTLQYQHSLLGRWQDYLSGAFGRPVEFVRRERYRETMDMLRLDRLDFAWICSYAYLQLRRHTRLLAVPLYEGRPSYRSYLIADRSNRGAGSIAHFRDTVFAFADPNSNSGYLVPRYLLRRIGESPSTFFRRTFFTYSHRKVIEAVAVGLAEGGAVDSYVWDTLARLRPELTARTRVVAESEPFGFSPFVANRSVAAADADRMQRILLDMGRDPPGAAILRELNLDGLAPAQDGLYDRVLEMMRALGEE